MVSLGSMASTRPSSVRASSRRPRCANAATLTRIAGTWRGWSCRERSAHSIANAHLGRLDEARAELGRVLAIYPEQTIAGFREYFHYLAPEFLELYVTGLRLAGLPEK